MYSTIDPVIRVIRWIFIDAWKQLLSRGRTEEAG